MGSTEQIFLTVFINSFLIVDLKVLCDLWHPYYQYLEASQQDTAFAASVDAEDLDREIEMMSAKLSTIDQKRKQLSRDKDSIMADIFEARVLRDSILNRVSCMEYEINQVNESIQSVDGEITVTEASIEKNKQINTMNDAFYIWFAGPFATINSLRLGNLPQKPVDFTEINAALGIIKPSHYHISI